MNTDTADMNELDCYFVWAQAMVGYADPNANKLGHLRAIAKSAVPITNENQMNSLACLRAIVSPGSGVKDTAEMNELDCLREIYVSSYSSGTEAFPSRLNVLDCLRGIVSFL